MLFNGNNIESSKYLKKASFAEIIVRHRPEYNSNNKLQRQWLELRRVVTVLLFKSNFFYINVGMSCSY